MTSDSDPTWQQYFPQTLTLTDVGAIELRAATAGDADAIVAFAKGLSEMDLLFLRVDITQPQVVANWLSNVEDGATASILAWQGDAVVGYGTVDRNAARWTRRVGEIRVNVAASVRGCGLGRQLTAKIFDVARAIGLRKLVAHMTPDQAGAQAAFSRLGFHTEAILADHVEDQAGGIHDLLIMSYDIDGLGAHVDAPLRL